MQIDPSTLEPRDLYRLMISVVVPRPIAWVSTRGTDGSLNAAPFSYFQALSSAPPTIMISVGKKRGGEVKDTRRNIEETGEFVVNIVGEDSAARMVQTSVAHDYGVSEFEDAGLAPAPSVKVKAPRIAECAVSMECKLDRVIEIGNSGVLFGEVVLFHLRDDVRGEGDTADPAKLRPLGRLGGSNYAPLREVLEITPGNEPVPVAGPLADLRRETIAACRAADPERVARAVARLLGAPCDDAATLEQIASALEASSQ